MRRGKASRTAQFLAYTRALGSLAPVVPGFSDPVAEQFLARRWWKKVKRARRKLAGSPFKSPYPFWLRGMGVFNQLRTAILDGAIEAALPIGQLVILGAGFDSRGWRLPSLEQTIVFEVDHPDTQGWKRNRAAGATPRAREVRFVAVDLSSEELGARLAEAGHDPTLPTFWLWEGVIMYLRHEDVRRTLEAIAARSAPGSMLAFTYMASEPGRISRSLLLVLLGEPIRSAYSPAQIADLTRAAGWTGMSDTGIEEWKSQLVPGFALTRKEVGLQWNERIWIGKR
jgi:methyltransferase (TIGR00027 family)